MTWNLGITGGTAGSKSCFAEGEDARWHLEYEQDTRKIESGEGHEEKNIVALGNTNFSIFFGAKPPTPGI